MTTVVPQTEPVTCMGSMLDREQNFEYSLRQMLAPRLLKLTLM